MSRQKWTRIDLVGPLTDSHVHPNGKFLYASNRGHDSIVICSIDERNGELEVLGYQSTMGKHPAISALIQRAHICWQPTAIPTRLLLLP